MVCYRWYVIGKNGTVVALLTAAGTVWRRLRGRHKGKEPDVRDSLALDMSLARMYIIYLYCGLTCGLLLHET